jgi:hypothetical protein
MLFDDFANDFLVSNNNLLITSPAVKSKTAEELLIELEQKVDNEPSWLHDNHKLDFTAFETLSAVDVAPTLHTAIGFQDELVILEHQEPIAIKKNTEELLHEFNTVYNAVGLQLTPPTTPPSSPISVQDVTGAPIIYIVTDDINVQEQMIDDTISEASECSMELIDELVREHSSSLTNDTFVEIDDESISNGGTLSPFSDASDPSYSPRSDSEQSSIDSFMSPKSETSFDIAGYDEEWTPTVDKLASKRNSLKASSANTTKKEKRPYGRPPHEKKARKKEQNKNAATKYRQKKKEELVVVQTEEQKLSEINIKLRTKYDDVKREISYLKKLMTEVLIAKGVQI